MIRIIEQRCVFARRMCNTDPEYAPHFQKAHGGSRSTLRYAKADYLSGHNGRLSLPLASKLVATARLRSQHR